MAKKTLDDVIDRLKREGDLSRNSGTNSIKSVKELLKEDLIEKSAERLQRKEDRREDQVRSDREFAALDGLSKAVKSGSSSEGSSGSGLSLGGLGGVLAGGGIGLGAAGAGLGAFFMGLAGAEAIMSKFGDGSNLKNLMTNLADGLAAFETRDLAAIGAVLGVGAVAGATPGLSGVGAGVGLGAVGVGLGAFFAGLAAADAAMSWMSTDMTSLKAATKGLSDALGELDEETMTQVGGLLVAGSAAGMLFGPKKVGKATIGMGAIGLGIGAFFAGLSAGDAAMSWMNTDGTKLKDMMKNLSEGLSSFASDDLKVVGGLLAGGAGAGALFGPSKVAKAVVGMGAIGVGIGAFFTGLAAGGKLADVLAIDGSGIKSLMTNVAEGLGAFGDRDLAAVGGMLAVGGLFGAVPGGLAVAGTAAIGMGVIGAGIGAFFTGLAGMTKIASIAGADGSNLKSIMVNLADGLKAFNDVDATNLLYAIPAIAGLGPAMLAFFGSEGIAGLADSIGEGFEAAWGWITGSDGNGESDPKKNRIAQMVEMLKPINELDASKMGAFNEISESISRFANAFSQLEALDVGDVKRNIGELANTISWSIPLLDKMANGGVIGSGYMDGYSEMDFGDGLLSPELRLGEMAAAMGQIRSMAMPMETPSVGMSADPNNQTIQSNVLNAAQNARDIQREAAARTAQAASVVNAPSVDASTNTVNRGGDVNINDAMMDPHTPDNFREKRN